MADSEIKKADYNNFDSIQIGIASPDTIKKWSHGEVTKPETINYRTLKPEPDGLYCEKIFGPVKDGECHCGKYKKNRFRGIVCDKCGVEVTSSKVRRTRMGHIELAAPVVHTWYLRGTSCRIGTTLAISAKDVESVVYFAKYAVTEVAEPEVGKDPIDLKVGQILKESEYRSYLAEYGPKAFKAEMGAEAIRKLLEKIDLKAEIAKLKDEIQKYSSAKSTESGEKAKKVKRLEMLQSFENSHNKPEWMVLTIVPVLPPDLRPLVQLDGGRFATSDLNDLYRRVINRNNRLKKLMQLHAPEVMVKNEKRMLQESVDSLFDNNKRSRPVQGPGSRPLKSLSDMLRGKQGRFRQNLLGKRVDYSGRSVIVVGPELKIYQCGIPKEMALELFKPFVMNKLVSQDLANNIKDARKKVEQPIPAVWDLLEDIIKEHPVLLNRAPTLHRLSIQAFEPVLVEGKALKLHPLVCTAFNADFDGDQMAIHLPLSAEAQAEARILMLSANNLIAPKDGKVITVPTQDMVLGSYYLTLVKEKNYENAPIFSSYDEAKYAYDTGAIKLHTAIKVRRFGTWNGEEISQIIETTMGKLIFNNAVPQDLGFVDRTKKENALLLEIDKLVKKGTLSEILDACVRKHGLTVTAEVLDKIKSQGYKFSTKGAITVGVEDIIVPKEKQEIIDATDKNVDKINELYQNGLTTEEERYSSVIKAWTKAIDDLTNILKKNMGEFNPINMMSDSGARGNINQIKQLAGMRGLMSATGGRTIEIPIKANFREGLDVLEFFISSHGTRKTLSDTALRTADSGYLTRRLVDVSQDVIIREDDCGSEEFIRLAEIPNENDPKKPLVPLAARIAGRFAAEDVVAPETGDVLVKKGDLIDDDMAITIEKAGVKVVSVRSVLKCKARHGVCSKCYGSNLASHAACNIGDAVGVIAAQSIGEPGTQLTMRTFHTGGVATADDITQGLPRVEELFEARNPKGSAVISRVAGKVSIDTVGNKQVVTITPNPDDENGKQEVYKFAVGINLAVKDGDEIAKGGKIISGSINPHDLYDTFYNEGADAAAEAVEKYIIEEIQKVYNLQGVKINDKHIEVIVRQMLRRVRIDDAGDTNLPTGSTVSVFDYEEAKAEAAKSGKKAPTGTKILLGITKAALATDSFLSAASFQETTKVLADSAIKSKRDPLVGLKENVLIGKLIPAGTGMRRYQNIEVDVSVLDHKPQALIDMEEAQRAKREQEAIEQSNSRRYKEKEAEDFSEVEYVQADETPVDNDENV